MTRALTLAGEIVDAAGLALIVAAVLLLAGCGVATTEPDCLREHPTCIVVESLDGGAGSESGGGEWGAP
ncbi:hypothetical protein [Elioraea sp.]|uniref:hypothetical protein n=1 Tax=Elioraea sp. TaxID=2185103 RepID=UPI0025C0E6C7|nr:hypothetical protein [Elioraea sp.]